MSTPPLTRLLAVLRRALVIVWCAAPRLALAQTGLAITQALLPLVTLIALKRTVDAAAALATTPLAGATLRQAFAAPTVQRVVAWLLIGALALALQACLRAWSSWVAEQHAMAVSDSVHAELHHKMLTVDIAFFENTNEQDRLHLVQQQAMSQPIQTLGNLFQLLYATISLIGVLALLAAHQPWLPALLIASGAPVLWLRLHRSRRLYAWRRELAPDEREAGYFHHLLVDAAYARELRLYGHGAYCRHRFTTVRTRLRQARLTWRRYLLSRELLANALMLLVLALALLWLTSSLIAGALTLGALVMAVQALQRGQGQVNALAATIAELYQSALFFEMYQELITTPAQIVSPPRPQPLPPKLQRGIVFENVSFAYPGTTRLVLRDLNFRIDRGERVVLVGANGTGKSTIIKLLTRLYDPTGGRILIDGVDLRQLDLVAWRQYLGAVFQDFGRYQLTAGENIWVGDPQGSPTDPRIAHAAHAAGLDTTIAAWPQGLATQLGRWLRPGVEPSVGQWQRVALARAMLRPGELLLLDEPTSALDTATRHEFIAQLANLPPERTLLIASHHDELTLVGTRVIKLEAPPPPAVSGW